ICHRYVRKVRHSAAKTQPYSRARKANRRGNGDTDPEFRSGGLIVGSRDPTDHALAAIASIRDNADDETALQPQSEAEKQAIAVIEDKLLAPEQPDGDSYFKVGPGPIATIRFKWSERRGES